MKIYNYYNLINEQQRNHYIYFFEAHGLFARCRALQIHLSDCNLSHHQSNIYAQQNFLFETLLCACEKILREVISTLGQISVK
jgi:hypothetical protein